MFKIRVQCFQNMQGSIEKCATIILILHSNKIPCPNLPKDSCNAFWLFSYKYLFPPNLQIRHSEIWQMRTHFHICCWECNFQVFRMSEVKDFPVTVTHPPAENLSELRSVSAPLQIYHVQWSSFVNTLVRSDVDCQMLMLM